MADCKVLNTEKGILVVVEMGRLFGVEVPEVILEFELRERAIEFGKVDSVRLGFYVKKSRYRPIATSRSLPTNDDLGTVLRLLVLHPSEPKFLVCMQPNATILNAVSSLR